MQTFLHSQRDLLQGSDGSEVGYATPGTLFLTHGTTTKLSTAFDHTQVSRGSKLVFINNN